MTHPECTERVLWRKSKALVIVSLRQALTVYDWSWRRGVLHPHLTYERGKEVFERDFQLDREPGK